LELGFIAACVVLLIIGCFLRNKVLIVGSLAAPMLAFVLLSFISHKSEEQNPFPYLRTMPTESLLPGIYVLDPSSIGYLKSRGFNNFSATIVLNADKTFKVTQMPHIWIDGMADGSGYDACSGSWSIGQNTTDQTYNVTLEGDKSVMPHGAAFLGIAAPKGERKTYALAVPIFTGDFDYVIFVRQ
jgi:hypothetical protein